MSMIFGYRLLLVSRSGLSAVTSLTRRAVAAFTRTIARLCLLAGLLAAGGLALFVSLT